MSDVCKAGTPNQRGVRFLRRQEQYNRREGRFELAVAFQECANWLEAHPEYTISDMPDDVINPVLYPSESF